MNTNTRQQNVYSGIKDYASCVAALGIWKFAEKAAETRIGRPTLTNEELTQINTTVRDVFEASGLKEKGIKLVVETADKGSKKSNIIKEIFNPQKHNPKEMFGNKEIHYIKESPLIAFHEMGHAVDFAFGNITKKALVVSSVAKLAAPFLVSGAALVAATAALCKLNKNKKQDNNTVKKEGYIDKIQKNYGKFAGIIGTTVLIPEITASIRAFKMASANLPKNLVKKVNRANIAGMMTYIMFGISLGLITNFIAKTDWLSILKPKEEK